MYEQLADFYDRLTDDFDYDFWTDHYLALLKQANPLANGALSLCECGCGTGSVSIRLAQRGHRVVGVDLSEAMLRRAAEKARAAGVMLRLVRQDMCALELPRPVDALIAPCDGVNYLLNQSRAQAFFARAHCFLKPGGVLAFDVSSRHKLERMGQEGLYYEDRDDLSYFWRTRLQGRELHMALTFFARQPGGLYRRLDETQRQYIHQPAELAEWLIQCGFENVCVYGGFTLDPPAPDEERLFFTAVRKAD